MWIVTRNLTMCGEDYSQNMRIVFLLLDIIRIIGSKLTGVEVAARTPIHQPIHRFHLTLGDPITTIWFPLII